MKNHQRPRTWRALLMLLAIIGVLSLASCGSDSDGASEPSGGSDGSEPAAEVPDTLIRISSQDFSEQIVLAQVYGQYLEDQGFNVEIQDPIGTRAQIFDALDQGDLDLQIDYTGFALSDGLDAESPTDPDEAYDALVDLLGQQELAASDQSEASDANALVALSSWATDNGVTTISDLADVDGTVTLGGAAECADRTDCLAGYNATYGLDLEFKVVDYGPPLVEALKADTIQVAQYGTTAAELASGDIVVLEDDKGLQIPGNVVPIFRSEVDSPELVEALNTISAALTTEDLQAWNEATDLNKEDPVDVATAWLEDNNLLG